MFGYYYYYYYEDVQKKRGGKEYKQPQQQEISNQVGGETGRIGVWFPEDGDSCYKTG